MSHISGLLPAAGSVRFTTPQEGRGSAVSHWDGWLVPDVGPCWTEFTLPSQNNPSTAHMATTNPMVIQYRTFTADSSQ